MAVQDPTFWKRFSIAVYVCHAKRQLPALTVHSHQDDAAKEEMAQHPELKHSYVISLAELPSSATPTTPPQPQHPQPPSPVAFSPFSPVAYACSQPTSPILPTYPGPNTLKNPNPRSSSRRPSNPFTRLRNGSQLTLGLSGRPQSRFKFWTSVSADPSNRDSWLESQQRKKKHRTWVCWGFWLCLLLVVGGVVAAILVLKSKGIM